jgi:Na+-transporting methylmalonyl-CoA/oxaloacetate decarboxylase gamma subunit
MRIIFIFLLIINVIVISVGEDPESENPTKSLEKGVEELVKLVHSFLKNVQSEDFVGKESGAICIYLEFLIKIIDLISKVILR